MILRELLKRVAEGSLSIEEAERQIRLLAIEEIAGMLRLDVGRELRKGAPEIVMGEYKDSSQFEAAIRSLVEKSGRAIASRLREEHIKVLEKLKSEGYSATLSISQRVAVVKKEGYRTPKSGGRVGIVAAGTADVPIADEVKLIVEELGCDTVILYDVGIAGLHRALNAAKKIIEGDVDVVVAIAGMEGALPSVLASLLDVPVIGLPISTGYGLGGGGIAALLSMLQSCSPGLLVVNIDNSVGAAVAAALMANRVAKFKCGGQT
ncbi:MAG: nickel pincer cofactor biosynthesis protein LarB [Candidatus Nezhaarchaeota archaeon]|nr:nickel pincer cofactor biosynthesis protein LarB [Candidatus Nezhaarchaeota archaeon]MCX8142442.1 nickel pincer cofactor biosynthesis protein LarB [Candidatus Nezhaarchaeota archaeon]MDW8050585.1 nickel pincer cofactor biosynthesis protein LarB [Nitrososphaerota archaeon]